LRIACPHGATHSQTPASCLRKPAQLFARGGCRHLAQHFAQQIRAKLSTWLKISRNSFGGEVASVYDGANRLISRVHTQTGIATLRIDQEWDEAGRLLVQRRYSDAAATQLIGTSTYTQPNKECRMSKGNAGPGGGISTSKSDIRCSIFDIHVLFLQHPLREGGRNQSRSSRYAAHFGIHHHV